MLENRLVVRLMGYWERLRKDDVLPDFKKNNPAIIEDLWQQCFVLHILPARTGAYKYEYLGDKIKTLYGHDYTGMTFDFHNRQFPNSIISTGLQNMIFAEKHDAPREENGQVPGNAGKIIKYRTILLPFGSEKAGLTHIVCGVSYREF